jgi:hypothetical protein
MTNFVINIGIKEVLGIVASLIAPIVAFTWFLSGRFSKIDIILSTIQGQLAEIRPDLKKVRDELTTVEVRLGSVEKGLDSLGSRLRTVEQKLV